MIAGAAKALAVHADVVMPDGTLVHLNPGAPSLFEMLEADIGAMNENQPGADEPSSRGDDEFDIFETVA